MRPIRYGTVIWGVLLLIGAALVVANSVLGPDGYDGTDVVWLVVGVGALLVVAAIIGAVARGVASAAKRATAPDATAAVEDQPVD